MNIEANMKVVDKKGLIAVGSIVLDGIITIEDVKMLDLTSEEDKIQGKKNWILSMPRRKGADGWFNTVVLRDPEIKKQIEVAVNEAIRKNLLRDLNLEPQIEVQIILCNKGTLKGYANVLYEKAVEIRSIQIHGDEEGIYIKLPYNINEGRFQILVHVNTERMSSIIKNKVEEAYSKAMQEREHAKGREGR